MKAFKQSNDNELLLKKKKKKKKRSVLLNLYIKKNVFHQFSNKINFLAYIFSFSFLSAYELQQGNNNSKKNQRKRTTIIAEREKRGIKKPHLSRFPLVCE